MRDRFVHCDFPFQTLIPETNGGSHSAMARNRLAYAVGKQIVYAKDINARASSRI